MKADKMSRQATMKPEIEAQEVWSLLLDLLVANHFEVCCERACLLNRDVFFLPVHTQTDCLLPPHSQPPPDDSWTLTLLTARWHAECLPRTLACMEKRLNLLKVRGSVCHLSFKRSAHEGPRSLLSRTGRSLFMS